MTKVTKANFDHDKHIVDPAWDSAAELAKGVCSAFASKHPFVALQGRDMERFEGHMAEAISEIFKEALRDHYRKVGVI